MPTEASMVTLGLRGVSGALLAPSTNLGDYMAHHAP